MKNCWELIGTDLLEKSGKHLANRGRILNRLLMRLNDKSLLGQFLFKNLDFRARKSIIHDTIKRDYVGQNHERFSREMRIPGQPLLDTAVDQSKLVGIR